MSDEQLAALIAKIKQDDQLRQQLQSAEDLEAAIALAQQAGFDVNKEDWLNHQRQHSAQELSDAELEQVAGGKDTDQAACSHGAGPYCPDSQTCPPERGGMCEW